ncbi:MAG: hypothetical protein WAW78_11370 [Propioniciclava sp.]
MPRIANAYDALIFAALATPVWVTVVVALMVVTTSGRPRDILHCLLLTSPLWTWLPVVLMLAITYSGWVPGTEAIVSSEYAGMDWIIVLVLGGATGLLAWLACLTWVAFSAYTVRWGRALMGWPFWLLSPVVLAMAWWAVAQRLEALSPYAFCLAFVGSGAWVLSAAWIGVGRRLVARRTPADDPPAAPPSLFT